MRKQCVQKHLTTAIYLRQSLIYFTVPIQILMFFRAFTFLTLLPSILAYGWLLFAFAIIHVLCLPDRNVDNTNIVKSDKIRKAIKIIRLSSLILCILICISTLTLKQHSFLDLVGGCVLFAFYYTIIYIRPFRQSKLSTDC